MKLDVIRILAQSCPCHNCIESTWCKALNKAYNDKDLVTCVRLRDYVRDLRTLELDIDALCNKYR